jgi:hypothetical protein
VGGGASLAPLAGEGLGQPVPKPYPKHGAAGRGAHAEGGSALPIEHLVLFKPRPSLPPEDLDDLIRRLQGLAEAGIPGLIELSAGRNLSPRGAGYACALRARLADQQALAGYAVHPAHLEVLRWVEARTVERVVADYEVPERPAG